MSHRHSILTEITQHATRLDAAGDNRWAGLNVALTVLHHDLTSEATHTELHVALRHLDDAIGMNVHNEAVRDGLLMAHRIVLAHADDFASLVATHA